jgi:hypothetical protein
MLAIEKLRDELKAIEESRDRGGTYPEELDAKIRSVRTEVKSLRRLLGHVLDHLEQEEAKQG